MSQTTVSPDLGRIFADPAAYADPVAWHETARRLRNESPITRVSLPDYQDFWAITRHADIMEIERNSTVFTNAPVPTLMSRADFEARVPGQASAVNTLIQMDGDEHRAHRGIVNDWFKPGSIKRMSDRIDALAKEWVDRMAAMDGQCDFANDIAMHYPLQVILSLLGLPEEDHQKMLKLTQELFGAEDPDIGRVSEDATVLDVMMDFVGYFTGLAADRRAHPTEDLASVIANAQLDGSPLPDMDVMGFYLIIATAGHDTTSNSIAGGLLALLQHPDQLALLQSDPSLFDDAAVELIRYVSPVKHFLRTCQEPVTVGGVGWTSYPVMSRCSPSPRATGTTPCSKTPSGSTCSGPMPRHTWPSGSAATSASVPSSPAWRFGPFSGSSWGGWTRSSSTASPRSCTRHW
jgi:cytochrome P450